MRIGSRWSVGEAPHPAVPDALHDDIRRVESEYPEARSWTLTWLEGRPHCTLDDLVEVTSTATGDVNVRERTAEDDEDDDDWLA